jgi:hypothetical protein
LQSQRFWNACIVGEAVALRLNASWQAILQRVLDRKK